MYALLNGLWLRLVCFIALESRKLVSDDPVAMSYSQTVRNPNPIVKPAARPATVKSSLVVDIVARDRDSERR